MCQPCARRPDRLAARKSSAGFTLVELSVVLVIIAVILGAVSVGGDLLRTAHMQRIFSEFVMGWDDSFTRYVAATTVVPGDNPLDPKHAVAGVAGTLLCNNAGAPALTNVFLARGVALPDGWGAGQEDQYIYQDSNGSPHLLRVCFITTGWSVNGTSSGAYVANVRHVMRLTGLTTELAIQLDALIDGRPDARFGKFREAARADSTVAAGAEWPVVRTHRGEENINEVTAYLEMK